MRLKKFVTINKFSSKTGIGVAFNELRKGINRTGVVTDGIGSNVNQQRNMLKFQADYLSDKTLSQIQIVKKETKQKNQFYEAYKKRLRRMFGVRRRQKAEDSAEDGVKDAKTKTDKLISKIGKPVKKLFGFMDKTIGSIIKWFVIFGALDFIGKNPEQIAKLGRFVFAIGKFGFNIVKLGVGGVLSGLTNVFGDYSDKGAVERGMRKFLGVFQIIGGIAALRTAQYLVMPWKLISDMKGINNMMDRTAMTTEEIKASQKARLGGYRDKKTGVIYSEKEYKAMQKSAQRADSKRAAKSGKGMKSDLYRNQFDKRFQKQFKGQKGKLSKLQQRARIGRGKMTKGIGKFVKGNPVKVTGALSVLGGGLRIASGLSQGEKAGEAVGAGVGQAVGGIAGAAALTAVAPFLGPFAPMIGSAIGGFLGEWVGKSFGKLAQPIFEPIKRAFGMYFEMAKALYKPFIDNLGPVLGEVFNILGSLGSLLFKHTKPLRDFTGFVLSMGFKAIGETVKFVIDNAKRLMDPKSMAAGFLDALTLNAFDLDNMNPDDKDKKKKKAWWDPAGVFTGKDKEEKPPEMAGGGLVSLMDTLISIAGHNPAQRKQEMAEGGKILKVPYYNQRANDDDPLGRKGDTQCYSTVMAMWTSYLTSNNVSTKEYNKTRSKYGSSTSASAQQKALKDYGIESKLQTGVQGYNNLKKEIDDGYPVPLGMKYTGSGHWAMLTGYSPLGWIVHDPFGQLGKGGNWIKKNSQDSKTEGVGKSYLMKKDVFQDQSPENDIWMWKAPRGIKEITKPKFDEPSKDLSLSDKAAMTVFDGFVNMKNSLSNKVKDLSGIKPTEAKDTQMNLTDTTFQQKAQRDADEEMARDVIVLTQTITQPVINNVGGAVPNIVYKNGKGPMLTEFT